MRLCRVPTNPDAPRAPHFHQASRNRGFRPPRSAARLARRFCLASATALEFSRDTLPPCAATATHLHAPQRPAESYLFDRSENLCAGTTTFVPGRPSTELPMLHLLSHA